MVSDGKKKLELLVIGLDGATFNVVLSLIKKNKLNTLKKIMEEGVYGELESTIPPISGPAWASFMTGKNCGKHGLFGFIDYDPQRYDGFLRGSIVTSSSFAGSTFFDILSSQGYKLGVITTPITYPPWMINGVMISGYPCPRTEGTYCCSENTQIEIKERLLHGREKYASTEEEISDAFEITKRITKIAIELTEKMSLNSLIIVFGSIDRMQHFFGISDRSEGVTAKCYQLVDDQIAQLLELAEKDARIFIMSDHGADPYPRTVFNTNRWLRQQGYLTLNEHRSKAFTVFRNFYYKYVDLLNITSKRFERFLLVFDKFKEKASKASGIYIESINWKKTRAFRYPMPATQTEGIVINVKGRQEKGFVEAGERYEELKEEIIEKLKLLRDPNTGKNVVETCYKREDIYAGEFIEKGPDIVFQLTKPYVAGDGLSEILTRMPSSNPKNLQIVHSMKGILISKSPVMKRGAKIEGARIIDLAPTILYSMGASIPKSMDGRILYNIFTDDFRGGRSPKYHFEEIEKRKNNLQLGRREEEEIKDRLRELGYI